MTGSAKPRTGTAPVIVRPDKKNTLELAQTIATSFHDLDASRFLIPDQALRAWLFPPIFGYDVEDTFDQGTVYATEDCGAVALWIPVAAEGLPAPKPDERIARFGVELGNRYHQFHTLIHERHPVGEVYHWLMILGVRPDLQGQGIGSALLDAHHDYLDQQGLVARLEAANRRAAKLYFAKGYDEVGDPLILPDGTQMIPMERQPQV